MNNVMDIVKKNLVSIICAVVALLAIGAVFWPISGMFEDLQTRADTSRSSYSSLEGLLKKTRYVPQLDATATEQKQLEQFPTDRAIERGNAVKAEIEKEAKAMLDAAVAINQKDHTVLVEGALPGGPQSRTPAMKFREEYQKYMQSMPARLMGAGMKPSDTDVAAEQKRVREDILTNDLNRDDKGRPTNQPQVDAKIATEVPLVPERMRMAAASSFKVYIDPTSLDIQGQIASTPGQPPQPSAVFWAQIGLWIQEDICRSIAEVNDGATNVLDSTVKRVMKIEVPDEFAKAGAVQQAQPQDSAFAAPPSMDMGGPITKNFVVSPTGRLSNPLYDVVHFKLNLICDAERVPAIFYGISKNKFMTIYRTDVSTVDSGAEQLNGYYYGTRPVVMLSMDGEALFLRQWLLPLIPDRIKTRELGLSPQPMPPQ